MNKNIKQRTLFPDAVNFKEISDRSRWSAYDSCSQCHSLSVSIGFKFSNGQTYCDTCLRALLNQHLFSRVVDSMDSLSVSETFESIKTKTPDLYNLALALMHLPKLLERYMISDDHMIPMAKSLGELLGTVDYPLASYVRNLAYTVSLAMGDIMVPHAREYLDSEPWQHAINSLMLLGNLDPTNTDVQVRLAKAWDDKDENIQRFIKNSFEKKEFGIIPWNISKSDLDLFKLSLVSFTQVSSDREYKISLSRDSELIAFILSHFKQDTLKPLYDELLSKVLSIPIRRRKSGKPIPITSLEYAGALTLILKEKELFETWFPLLSEGAQSLLKELSWRRVKISARKWEERVGESVLLPKAKDLISSYTLSKKDRIATLDYSLFQYGAEYSGYRDLDYSLYLDDALRKAFKGHIPEPEWSRINYLKEPPSAYVYADEGKILEQLPVIQQFLRQTPIKRTAAGKPVAKYLRDFANLCGIREFYPLNQNKDLKLLRAQLILEIHSHIRPLDSPLGKPDMSQSPEVLRGIVEFLFREQHPALHLAKFFMPYLKISPEELSNMEYFEGDSTADVFREQFHYLMSILHQGGWVGLENYFLHLEYKEEIVSVLPDTALSGGLYFNQTDEEYYPTQNRIRIVEGNYWNTFYKPMIKTCCSILGALGLLDLSLEEPINPAYQHTTKPYLTKYDGLEAIRLTPLGAYVFGFTNEVSSFPKPMSEPFALTLDEKYLMISTIGVNRVKELALESLGEKVAENVYVLSYQSFLEGCDSLGEVKKKIHIFREMVETKPPRIYEEFFEDILSRFDPLEEELGYVVYRITKDPGLSELLRTDPYLKKNVIRAEGRRILINQRKVNKVKQKLKQAGFFI
jgi:hypothetical protein